MKFYQYHHVVTLEETNLVGNVYYVNFVRWQGRCREMFMRDHARSLLDELQNGLALVTTYCSCRYLAELRAFDEIVIRMSLGELRQNRFTFRFQYRRHRGQQSEEIVGSGEQEVAVMRRHGEELLPSPIPPVLRDALSDFDEGGRPTAHATNNGGGNDLIRKDLEARESTHNFVVRKDGTC